MQRCEIKRDFSIGGKSYKAGDSDNFTDEQSVRLVDYLTPIVEKKNLDSPLKDKMVKQPEKKKRGKSK